MLTRGTEMKSADQPAETFIGLEHREVTPFGVCLVMRRPATVTAPPSGVTGRGLLPRPPAQSHWPRAAAAAARPQSSTAQLPVRQRRSSPSTQSPPAAAHPSGQQTSVSNVHECPIIW